jgi:type I restriction-modification system DNA methylase subunit
MKHRIYKYIQTHFPQQPKYVDRLIVSAYFKKNNLTIKNNEFLRSFIIKETNSKAIKKLNEFIELVGEHFDRLDIETMIELFEFVISPFDRVITGAVYTPKFIREYIVQDILKKNMEVLPSWKGADIACGCGGFLYTMAKQLKSTSHLSYESIFKNHIFGLDIKKYAIARTKILLTTLAISEGEDKKEFAFNLFVGDALNFNWKMHISRFKGFDCVVGNPPYVCSKKIEPKTKKLLPNYEVCKTGHPDLYIPFFQIALETLLPNGNLGFITMNSFFKSLNGRALRQYFHKNQFRIKIIDFGNLQIFRKRSTYTCICLIQKTKSSHIKYRKATDIDKLANALLDFQKISYSSLKSKSGWNLLYSDIIHKIESVGTPFSTKFKTRTGIATLKNEIFIFKPVKEDNDFYYLKNGKVHPIEKSICKEIINSNKLSAENSIKTLLEKCIFPYEFADDKALLLPEKKLRAIFPKTHKYLVSKKKILSTRDKGQGEYPNWFAYGRTQCLEKMTHKLFFPHITSRTPHYLLNSDENLLFYNGLAVIGSSERELLYLKKIMSSRLFWFYILHTSKPYTSDYFSLSKNYIKDFGVYNFSEEEVDFIIKEDKMDVLNAFFEEKYGVSLV